VLSKLRGRQPWLSIFIGFHISGILLLSFSHRARPPQFLKAIEKGVYFPWFRLIGQEGQWWDMFSGTSPYHSVLSADVVLRDGAIQNWEFNLDRLKPSERFRFGHWIKWNTYVGKADYRRSFAAWLAEKYGQADNPAVEVRVYDVPYVIPEPTADARLLPMETWKKPRKLWYSVNLETGQP
jgi:hypothetical protein